MPGPPDDPTASPCRPSSRGRGYRLEKNNPGAVQSKYFWPCLFGLRVAHPMGVPFVVPPVLLLACLATSRLFVPFGGACLSCSAFSARLLASLSGSARSTVFVRISCMGMLSFSPSWYIASQVVGLSAGSYLMVVIPPTQKVPPAWCLVLTPNFRLFP